MKLKINFLDNLKNYHRSLWIFSLLILTVVLSSFSSITKEGNKNIENEKCENPLDVALGYNSFIKRNMLLRGGESEGPIALGNDLTINGLYVVALVNAGDNYFGSSEPFSLVINGKIHYQQGEGVYVNRGYANLGNTAGSRIYTKDTNGALSNTRITGGSYDAKPRIQVQTKESITDVRKNLNIDFEAAFNELNSRSLKMSKLPANNVLGGNSKIKLLPNQVNVINIKGSTLKSLQHLTFENKPTANNPLVINVDANGEFIWNVPNLAGLGDHDGSYIIWNFFNTSNMELLGGGSVIGTILAPKATIVKKSSGNVNGQIIAVDYSHLNGELHHHPFRSCVTLEEECDIAVTIEADSDFIDCDKESISLNAIVEGESSCGITYKWSNGATTPSIDVNKGGIYNVEIEGCDDCKATATFCVSEKGNPLGEALGYNAFVKGDVTVMRGDFEGALALGNDLTVDGTFAIAAQSAGNNYVSGLDKPVSLVTNGRIIYTSGDGIHLNNGLAKLGDTTGTTIYDKDPNGASVNTRLTPGDFHARPAIRLSSRQSVTSVIEKDVIDFAAAFTRLEQVSTRFSNMTPTNRLVNGNIQLIENQLNVLNLTGNNLKSLSHITFKNKPNSTTPVIINVNVTGNFNWNILNLAGLGDQDGAYIVWNFYNATNIILEGGGTIVGSVLAPKANIIKKSSGNINGQVIAANYIHENGELHNHPLEICILMHQCLGGGIPGGVQARIEIEQTKVYPTFVDESSDVFISVANLSKDESVEILIYDSHGIEKGTTHIKSEEGNKEIRLNLSAFKLKKAETYFIKINSTKNSTTKRIFIK
ncbi:collagen-binding domain-containing protein [Tenacibaculum amylolyticum]|uniref:collagen-binding domain-containing protein n=1 Tax=Tenacibaculum amylolyticum TaxID=104269 RepID=UPI0038931292